MIKILIALIVLSLNTFANKSEKAAPVDELKQLIRTIIPNANNKKAKASEFNIHGCKDYGPQWLAYFIFRQEFKLVYGFSQSCDVEASFMVKTPGPFSTQFKLKDFGQFRSLIMNTKITPNIEKNTLELNTTKGILLGNKKHYFQSQMQIEFEMIDNKLKSKQESGQIIFYKDDQYKQIIHTEKIGKQ